MYTNVSMQRIDEILADREEVIGGAIAHLATIDHLMSEMGAMIGVQMSIDSLVSTAHGPEQEESGIVQLTEQIERRVGLIKVGLGGSEDAIKVTALAIELAHFLRQKGY